MMTLKDQVAIITGASGGIGRAIAGTLAQQGAILCVLGRNKIKLDEAAACWQAVSPSVEVYPCDLTRDDDIDQACNQIAGKHARADILVHCAGTIEQGKLADTPLASLDQQYSTNVRGPLMLTQKLLPLLKKPRGQIVFINSSAGLNASVNAGYYSASKHAFKAIADSLRDEVNADGIRVLSVFPGRTATPLMEALYRAERRSYRPELLLQPTDVSSVVLNALTLPWTAEITNISIRPMQKSY
jgi:NADP-dependent 3-hydroxy acid dehydrogenase YdfG